MSTFNNDEFEFADPQDIASNKFMAICSYLGILVLIPLLLAKQSTFATFHARQGINVFLLYVLLPVFPEALQRSQEAVYSVLRSALGLSRGS